MHVKLVAFRLCITVNATYFRLSFPLCDIKTNKRRRFSKVTNQRACFKEEGRFFSFVRSDLCSAPLNRLIYLPTNIVSH